MYDFIVGMLLGSLLTIVPLLVWDRVARSRAGPSSSTGTRILWQSDRGNPTDR